MATFGSMNLAFALIPCDFILRMDPSLTVSECIQFTYHRALRNHIILMYHHDILILDLYISMTVGVISIDRSFSPFCQVIYYLNELTLLIYFVEILKFLDVFLSTT